MLYYLQTYFVPIAQLDRASDCGSEGWKFKSSWARILRYKKY